MTELVDDGWWWWFQVIELYDGWYWWFQREAKNKAEETIESAKDTIASNYKVAKQKSKKIKDKVAGRGCGCDEELWGNLGIKDQR